MGCGAYGSSRYVTSSSARVTDRAPTAASRCVIFVAPMMGAVTGFFCSSQESAIWTRGTHACLRVLRPSPRPVDRFQQSHRICLSRSDRFRTEACSPTTSRASIARRRGGYKESPRSSRRAERQHLLLLFAVDQVQVILHRNKARPTMLFGDVQRLLELPREHGGGTYVSGLSCLHDVM